MTELNPLLEAMNSIDDEIVASAQSPVKNPKLLRVGIVAAVAAAFLLVGYTVVSRSEIRLADGRLLDIRLELQENVLIPEEFMDDSESFDILPSEVHKRCNIPSLINDNFTELPSTRICLSYKKNEICRIQLVYDLVDNISGQRVYVSPTIALTDNEIFRMSYGGDCNSDDFEFVTLKNGNKALIQQNINAYFTYDGILYQVMSNAFPNGEYVSRTATVKEIMERLGVL